MGSVTTVAIRCLAPHRFQVRMIDPFRHVTVKGDLRAIHPAQWVDLPQTLAHQGVGEAPHRAQRRVYCRLGAKTRAVREVARDHLSIDALDPDAWAMPVEAPSPTDSAVLLCMPPTADSIPGKRRAHAYTRLRAAARPLILQVFE